MISAYHEKTARNAVFEGNFGLFLKKIRFYAFPFVNSATLEQVLIAPSPGYRVIQHDLITTLMNRSEGASPALAV